MAKILSKPSSISVVKPGVLPAWVPQPGQFANIGTHTMLAARPAGWPNSDVASPFANWSGGAFAPDFGALGGYVVHGSGHLAAGTPLWAGVWVFDLAEQVWKGRNIPPQPLPEGGAHNEYAEYTDPAVAGHTYPPHCYDGLLIQRKVDGGGPSGHLIRVGLAGMPISGAKCVHAFDLSSADSKPKRVINNLKAIPSSYPQAAVDYARGGFWALAYNGNGPLGFVKFSDWSETSYSGSDFNEYGDYNLIYLPPPYDALLSLGRTGSGGVDFGYYCLPLSQLGSPFKKISGLISGSAPARPGAGGQWSTLLGKVVSYEGFGSTKVHHLTPPPPDQLLTGQWTWTSQTMIGVNGATPSTCQSNSSYSRFIEVPHLKCFIWCDSVAQPVQAWRLA